MRAILTRARVRGVDREPPNEEARVMRRLSFVLALCVLAGAQQAHGQPTAAEIRGDWVPASSDCASSKLRFRVGETQVTLANGNQLFSVFFNADEKKGVTKLVFEEGVERPEPQFDVYTKVFRKAKALKARFPLTGDLKHCGASKPAAAPPAPSPTER